MKEIMERIQNWRDCVEMRYLNGVSIEDIMQRPVK